MKKFLAAVILSALMMFSCALAVVEREDIKLVVNGVEIENEDVPIIENERTLIPLRALVTKLGVQDDDEHIIWNNEERKVTVIKDDITIILTIDSDAGIVNGKEIKLDAPAMIYNNRTYIPARFVGEALNKKIGWDSYDSRVLIRDMEKYEEVKTTMEKVNTTMSLAEKYKLIMSVSAKVDSGTGPEPFITMDTENQIDVKNEEMYTKAQMQMMGMEVKSEQYYKDKKCYVKNNEIDEAGNTVEGKWEIDEEASEMFETVFEQTKKMAQPGMLESAYDMFIIDQEQSTEDVIVIKNDIFCKELISQMSSIYETTGVGGQASEEDMAALKSMEIKYVINRKTNEIKAINIKAEVMNSGVKSILEMAIEIQDLNGNFVIVKPE